MSKEYLVETDVLVIGGGMAGCFAAVKAKEQGLKVTIADKSYVGKSGQTPYATSFAVFHPEWRHDLDTWMNYINSVGEYVNNREWTKIVLEDSYARYQELVSWGVRFLKEDGKLVKTRSPRGITECLRVVPRKYAQVLREQVEKSEVEIIDRVMVTGLLKHEGGIIGAIGIPMDVHDLYIFLAKATIICMGASGFKPLGWPIGSLTGDGEAIAYRAGAEITGKEFVDTHSTRADRPGWKNFLRARPSRGLSGKVSPLEYVNVEGSKLKGRDMTLFLEKEFEAHAGRAPIFLMTGSDDKVPLVGGASVGMSVHKAQGIWPTGADCATSLPGLYAAGDSLGTMQVGAVYGGWGQSLAGSAVTGARAGLGAAEYALKAEKPAIISEKLEGLKKDLYMPTERIGGFSPGWVTQVLQNIMAPYFILFVKHGERMQAALTLVEFMRDNLLPKLTAKDAHELRLAHETRNMVLNAEMMLRASIFRTESRGCHYREDYPGRDDPAWLAWVKLKEEQGQMKLLKVPVPKEWWPDLSEPYEARYPARLPGEEPI